MDNAFAGAVEAIVEEPEQSQKPAAKDPRILPPHAVVVLNDDDHSFDYVIEVFRKVFGYSTEKGYVLAKEIHETGRGIVWSGTKELAELKRDQVRSAGPDVHATRKVEFPLQAFVEPLPG